MRAPLIAIVLCSVGGAVCAQPADEASKMLDTCFQLARTADAMCSNPKNGEAERLDCRQKASMAQLECLERVFPGRTAESAPPEMPARKKRVPEQLRQKRPLQPSRRRSRLAPHRPAYPRGTSISLQCHRIHIGS